MMTGLSRIKKLYSNNTTNIENDLQPEESKKRDELMQEEFQSQVLETYDQQVEAGITDFDVKGRNSTQQTKTMVSVDETTAKSIVMRPESAVSHDVRVRQRS